MQQEAYLVAHRPFASITFPEKPGSSTILRLLTISRKAKIPLVDKEFYDPIDAQAITSGLATSWLGKPTYYYPEITSTNERLKEVALEGAAEGTLIISDYQSQGKGRLSRRWIAPKGSSLLLSLLFRPKWPVTQINWIMMAASLAAKESVLSVLNLEVQLKWPNDLMISVNGRLQKFAGLLLELVSESGGNGAAVLGIGINVNNEIPRIPNAVNPAVSLRDVLGHPVNRLPLLLRFLDQLEQRYELANQGKSPQPEWEKSLITIGAEVNVSNSAANYAVTVRAIGTDQNGRLLVKDKDSKIHKISAADVTLRS